MQKRAVQSGKPPPIVCERTVAVSDTSKTAFFSAAADEDRTEEEGNKENDSSPTANMTPGDGTNSAPNKEAQGKTVEILGDRFSDLNI
mmetsp:Transcript_21721/g.43185  ORF Transcript_21721/g.43185 Transcript_21721/m.43185 type:complete len:88 (+) Transcript_21721:1019-1282(+)